MAWCAAVAVTPIMISQNQVSMGGQVQTSIAGTREMGVETTAK